MKHARNALLLTAALAGGSAAQSPSRAAPGAAAPIAVVEFTPAADAAAMTPNAKRWLQAQLAATLHDTRRFHVYDTRHTRRASQDALSAINHDSSTAAAVQLGRQLGVRYVLTGTVARYTAQGDGGFGHTTLRTRLVDVATGRVHHTGETAQRGTGVMRTAGEAEMQAKVMKPAIDALTATLLAALPAAH